MYLFSIHRSSSLTRINNIEFQKVPEYFRINKMVLHPDKTSFMLFSRGAGGTDLVLLCNNNNDNQNKILPNLINELDRVTSANDTTAIKFLGAYFDPSLNFKFHISTLKQKVILCSLCTKNCQKKTLNQKSLLLIYNSIFHCHLLYAIRIWSCSRFGPIGELFKMQKAAIRIVAGAKSNSHC